MRLVPVAAIAGVVAILAMAALAQQPDGRDRLFDALKNAPTEAAGRMAENAIWEYWMAAGPTEGIRLDVAEAMRARDGYDFDAALEILNGVVADAPDYAEGWNQRAFVHFLKGSLDESLEDIDRALELEPKHFAALSGKAIVLMQQGRVELSQKALRQAVAIHPWLRERSMLIPEDGDKPLPPGGKDI